MRLPSVIDSRMVSRLRPLIVAAESNRGTTPDFGEVFRKANVDDGQGGTTEIWGDGQGGTNPFYSGPVRIERGQWAVEAIAGGALMSSTPWILTFEALTTIRPEDRIRTTSAETGTVRNFEVRGLTEVQSYSAETQVLATEIF